jgi:hypothetical protein
MSLSTYPTTIDSFTLHTEILASDIPYMVRIDELQKIPNKTKEEADEYNSLIQTYRDKLFISDDLNKLQDCIVNLELFFNNNVIGYIQTKQGEFNVYIDNAETKLEGEIAKFTDKGIYDPSTQYYAKNYVVYNDGTGDNIYLCYKDCINILPTDTTCWRKLGIKGTKGENGIGLNFKGTWNNSTTYAVNDAVQYGGKLFGALQSNTGQEPNLSVDTTFWSKALDVSTTVKELIGVRVLTSNTSNINFITGEIIAFNPNTDSLAVYKNSTRLTKGYDYTININNQSIDKISGVWESTSDNPNFFEFVVERNMINGLVFSDGQSLQNGTVTKNKLSTDVQGTLDKIGSDVLNTTSQTLSGSVNELAGEGRTTETIRGNADKIEILNTTVTSHEAENATLTTKGHVQLQTTVDDTEIKALTPKALNVHASDNTKHLPTGGNVGQFLQKTSDGFSFADVPKMQLISSVTLSSQTAQIDFANIPTGYKKLRLEIIAKSTKTSIDNMVIKINDDASLVYDSELMWGYYANIYATTYYSYSGFMLYNSLSSASGDACYSEVNITNVPTEVKQMQSRTLARNMNSQTGLYFAHTMGQYKNNVEINKVSLLTSSSTIYFDIGSIFRLWGEK